MLTQKRKTYSSETLQSAVESVNKGERNLLQASKIFGVPRQTLADKVNGRHPGSYGGRTTLSEEDEEVLVQYVLYMASIGHPLTVADVKCFAWSVGKRSSNPLCFTENGPSEKWWRGFKSRHPRITLRKADKLDRRRKAMSKPSVMHNHFDQLKQVLENNDLLDKPSHIFNVDETGVDMDSLNGKVVVDRNTKHAYQESRGEREHITANVCCSASGLVLPPMIIFERCFPSGHYSKCGPDSCLYGKSPNGYMDGDLFKSWFTTIFLPYTAHLRPAVLILDGHGSHLTIDVIDLAREHNVILYCLPPHTTHLLQPLDVSVFKSLKAYFAKLCGQVKLLTLGTPKVINVNRTNFTAIFREAFENSMSIPSIKNGFRKCGVYPFSPEAIDWSKVLSDDATTSNAVEEIPEPIQNIPLLNIPECIQNNPLLENNIIPRRLIDAFVIPHLQEAKKQNTRITTSARVLTSDQHRDLVRIKLDGIRKAEIEKEKRKEEREKKNKKKLGTKVKVKMEDLRKSKRVPRKDYAKMITYSTTSEEEEEEEEEIEEEVEEEVEEELEEEEDGDTCAICCRYAPPGRARHVDWIYCDMCGKWYHTDCEIPDPAASVTYTCKRCA